VSALRLRIDFNCDLGEDCGDDAAILPCISSASIACGQHAGSPPGMRRTLLACREAGVAVGAHPGFADREHFGRREHAVSAEDAYALVQYQVAALAGMAHALGMRLQHVKPHGALYNQSARDPRLAAAIADAVADLDPGLALVGLAGSCSIRAARERGLQAWEEVFAERRYAADGQLSPRGVPGAVIEDLDDALQQVHGLLDRGSVTTLDGTTLPLRADTLCLHGDRPDAARFARALREALESRGVDVCTPDTQARP